VDPAALRILISRLTGVAEEMGAVLRRAAFSPNIKERADCSAALFTADGELLVQAEHIPVHLGSMPASVRAAIDVLGDAVRPGDQVLVNDPFAGGTHLNDLTLVAPCSTADSNLVGWVANRAHHADVGGMAPGSIPPDAVEVFQEGLRLPPVRLTDEVEAVLLTNSRTPEERRGDLDAQRGANVVGVERLARFADAPLAEITDYGERRMRAAMRVVALGRAARSSAGVKTRMPLPKLIVVFDANDRDRGALDETGELTEIMKEELNVKAVEVRDRAEGLVREIVKPDLKVLGPRLGKDLPRVRQALADGRYERQDGRIRVEGFDLGPDEVLVSHEGVAGHAVARDAGATVALETMLTPDLPTAAPTWC